MGHADRRYTRIVDDATRNMAPYDESMEDVEEVAGLSDEAVGR